MTWFLLGMLVMWFCYPLLKATQTTMVMKWTNLTINKEEIDENTTIGFKIGGQMNNLICRKDECDNTVECDVDVVAITCSDCCVELGITNNITFGGQYGEFSNSHSMVWKHGCDMYCSDCDLLYD